MLAPFIPGVPIARLQARWPASVAPFTGPCARSWVEPRRCGTPSQGSTGRGRSSIVYDWLAQLRLGFAGTVNPHGPRARRGGNAIGDRLRPRGVLRILAGAAMLG